MAQSKETIRERETKVKQDAFLVLYSRGSSLRAAAVSAGTTRWTVRRWLDEDRYGFADRFGHAQADFKDSLIEMAMGRLQEQKASDSPLLLITMLNAYIPEKFRPTAAATEEVAKDTIKELRTLAKNAFVAKPAEEMSERSAMQQVEEIILQKKGHDGD